MLLLLVHKLLLSSCNSQDSISWKRASLTCRRSKFRLIHYILSIAFFNQIIITMDRVLTRIGAEHGLPETTRVDDGSEFTSNALDQWAYAK